MKALGFGAIVWDDITPELNLGGAVLNVLGHLGNFGWQVAMVSALGRDSLGDRSVESVLCHAIDMRWCQRVDAPTCLVHVEFDDRNEPSYSMADQVSWDCIALDAKDLAAVRAEAFDVFCFGTIEQRDARSRETLRALLEEGGFKRVFLDLNLRPPFYDKEVVEYSLRHCDIVKLNLDEAAVLREMFNFPEGNTEEFAADLRSRFAIDQILLTAGSVGAYYANAEGFGFRSAYRVTVSDPVGAGDAFSAGLLHCLLDVGGELESACDFGCRLGALIASKCSSLPVYALAELDDLQIAGDHGDTKP